MPNDERPPPLMDRRRVTRGAAAVLAAGLAPLPAVAAARRPPNVVLILCDDLGYGDVEPFGDGRIKTPNLRRMAGEGMAFSHYYAPANICSPSRAALLTGRYAVRTGLGWGVILANDTRGLPLSEVTLPKALKPQYATALIGKWHLGHTGAAWPPTRHGFDAFFGLPYSHDISPLSLYEARGETIRVVEAEVDYPRLQEHFCARAERFIDENRDRPFFLELALSAPHLPEHPRPPFEGVSPVGPYGDVVTEIDAIVGRVLGKLRALRLERDTLVIFTSDNGPWYEGSAGALRDRKGGGPWEGGFRVPFIAWRPGYVPAGRRSDAVVMGIDLLPTICAMAGVAPPAGVKLDGADITGVLTGQAEPPERTLLLFNDEDVAAVRRGRWKLVMESYYRNLIVPLEARHYAQLHDMQADPSESYNVAARHPEVFDDMMRRWQAARAEFEPLRTHASTVRPPAAARAQD